MKLCQCQATYLHCTNETVPKGYPYPISTSPGWSFCPYCSGKIMVSLERICLLCGGEYLAILDRP